MFGCIDMYSEAEKTKMKKKKQKRKKSIKKTAKLNTRNQTAQFSLSVVAFSHYAHQRTKFDLCLKAHTQQSL